MKQATARIRELQQLDSRWAVIHLDCPDLRPAPGQFALADLGGYLLSTIFPRRLAPEGFSFAAELALANQWQPGATLSLLGPCGSPARPPASVRRLLLIHDQPGPPRLLPLADEILSRAGAVALLAGHPAASLASLADEIEIQRGPLEANLSDALAWADVVCVDAPPERLDSLRQSLRQARPFADSLPAFALLTPPMPCGVGACDVCWVKTGRGSHRGERACVDGPVFPLSDNAATPR